jgi:hypothetical protein
VQNLGKDPAAVKECITGIIIIIASGRDIDLKTARNNARSNINNTKSKNCAFNLGNILA